MIDICKQRCINKRGPRVTYAKYVAERIPHLRSAKTRFSQGNINWIMLRNVLIFSSVHRYRIVKCVGKVDQYQCTYCDNIMCLRKSHQDSQYKITWTFNCHKQTFFGNAKHNLTLFFGKWEKKQTQSTDEEKACNMRIFVTL